LLDWLIALVAAGTVSTAAWRLGALSVSGALAGTLVGALVFASAGLGAAAVLAFFFVTSSVLSALPPAGERSARNARQVLANGSIAAVAATLTDLATVAVAAFLGAIAAATADTWATEIGIRWGRRPRSLLTLRRQPPGTSGAVSLAGTAASFVGALAVALAGCWWLAGLDRSDVAAVALAGCIGSLIDSLLGGGPQAVYRCRSCGATPQVARHDSCSATADRVRGVPGLDNDVVNWIATGAGAALAVLLSRML
jgi:uncharacterized protein (TIGR00297 family)